MALGGLAKITQDIATTINRLVNRLELCLDHHLTSPKTTAVIVERVKTLNKVIFRNIFIDEYTLAYNLTHLQQLLLLSLTFHLAGIDVPENVDMSFCIFMSQYECNSAYVKRNCPNVCERLQGKKRCQRKVLISIVKKPLIVLRCDIFLMIIY